MKAALKALKNRLRPRWIKTGRRLFGSRRRLARVTSQLGLRPICGNPLGSLKQSNTLFILGSGGSINQLDDAAWAEIGAADSIGFNFWPLHDFVPSLYVTEICDVPPGQEANYANYRHLMAARAADYAATPILIKDGERVGEDWLKRYIEDFPPSLRGNIALSWDWEVPDETPEALAASLRFWSACGLLKHPAAPLLRKRASIFYLILLGLRAGYERIVLCGVDLDNSAYFYQPREAEYAAKGRLIPQPVYAPTTVHKTDNPTLGEMTISVALAVLDREILQPQGVQLAVGLPSSRLHPMLPAHFAPAQTA